METKTFAVPNIGCDGCVRTIKTEIGEIAGVKQVDADENTKIVTVKWDNPASWMAIENKLVEIDYPPANT
jgi:copper chaperone